MESRNKKFLVIGLVLVLAVALVLFFSNRADADDRRPVVSEPCVPSEAWTEVIEHPEVSHEETIHHDAVTHEETVVVQEAVPAVWANFQPNDHHAPFVGPPSYPADARGSWNVHNQLPPGHEGPDGVYAKGNPAKGGNWFYRQAAVEEVTETIVVVDQEAYDEVITVVDEEAWTETIEHPEVTCEGEQPEPEVTETSSSSYACGDDFETVTTVTTTTEYVLVEGQWVLGDPVEETVVTENPVDVVECDVPEQPDEPEEPNTPVNNPPAPKQPAAVPFVIDAGL